MHSLKWIRDNEIEFDAALARRGVKPVAQILLGLDKQQRALQTKLQGAKGRRNQISRDISIAKKRGEKFDHLSEEVNKLKTLIRDVEQEERALIPELQSVMDALPNLPANDVPDGLDESGNIEVRRVGKPPDFDFVPQDHVCIGEALAMMDFQTARKMSGPRFVVLKDDLARLERALANFMLDLHVDEFGFHETKPPSLVKDDAVYGTGQLPKFSGDLFQTKGGSWLIPTSEVPLTNLVMDQVLKESELPMRRTAYTNCYRSEAGSAGRDTRGMIRLHEFTKVEMVSIAHPDNSDAELEFLTQCAEEVLRRLKLPYRVVVLSCGDMGFSAQKTYDIEVWLPGQNTYREISSCSNCGEFQARRMKARFRPSGVGKGTRLVHTLNGSGLAVGRTLIAIMENYQQPDGSIIIPEALRPYMRGREIINGEKSGF